ncbi:hypothetical protein Tco_0839893 [Tanacetum coccineum]|uniref:Uncharacterized protein n=1 Tax=Tanacetum coccineum TaxID=301880 RepID=A0ABQ5AWI1_9ASTR
MRMLEMMLEGLDQLGVKMSHLLFMVQDAAPAESAGSALFAGFMSAILPNCFSGTKGVVELRRWGPDLTWWNAKVATWVGDIEPKCLGLDEATNDCGVLSNKEFSKNGVTNMELEVKSGASADCGFILRGSMS